MGSYNKRISDQSKIKFDPINRELIDSENSELDARVESLEENMTGAKTATGNSLTVTDAAPVNAVNLSMDLEPIQDLHGYDNPWAGGAGKNKLPMTVEGIKSANTSGTWSGNTYTLNGVTFEVLTDSADNVEGIKVNGTTNAVTYFDLVQLFNSTEYAGMIANFSGAVSGTWIRISESDHVPIQEIYGDDTVIVNNGNNLKLAIRVDYNKSPNTIIYPMIRLATETDPTFAPYTNICPISGRSQVIVTIKDNPSEPTVTKNYTIQLGQTVYGGQLDVTKGKMVVDSGYIASYNGETLPSTWISDRDVYASETSPTTGAQVVYELATPFTIDLTPTQIKLLENANTITTDYDGDVLSLEYQPNNAFGELLGEVNNIYDSIIEDIYDKIDSLDTRVTALEE